MGGSGLGISFCCSISLIVGQILHCSLLTVQSAGFELKSTTAVGSETNVRVKSLGCARLFVTPWTVVYQAPPSMGFSRQEYWHGLPFPSPGDLPNPRIKPRSPALQADALCLRHQEESWDVLLCTCYVLINICSVFYVITFFFVITF